MTYGLKEAHDELLAELEDLRAKYAEVCETSAMLRADMSAARERQAKLRELLDYMTPIAWYCASERERDRMRELGMEVDG